MPALHVLLLLLHYAGSPVGALPLLAAAHPEAYTAFLDCFLRSPVLQAFDMLAIQPLLLHAFSAVLSSDLAGNTAVVAGLASAYTSMVKRTTQFIQAAAQLLLPETEHERAAAAAACFPAAMPDLVGAHLRALGIASLRKAANEQAGTSGGAGSGSLSSQAAASTALLAVVLARSIVQLADALQTAGPQLFYKCFMEHPRFKMMWQSGGADQSSIIVSIMQPRGGAEEHTVERQWQCWQQAVLQAHHVLLACMRSLGMAPEAAAAQLKNL
jgi:hypothetical protein